MLKFSTFVLVNSANAVPKAINRAICRSLRLNLWKIANFVFLRWGEVRAEGDSKIVLPNTESGLLSLAPTLSMVTVMSHQRVLGQHRENS